MITIRPAKPSDAAAWLRLRHALWPEGSEAEHREDIDRFFVSDAREPLVAPNARGRGVGRALIAAAEQWGRSRGCREFASDSQANDEIAGAAHRALGFAEVGLVRCFRKDL